MHRKQLQEAGGHSIGIARVVVVRAPVSVDIAEIVRVVRIDRPQPPIRRRFYQDVTVDIFNFSYRLCQKFLRAKQSRFHPQNSLNHLSFQVWALPYYHDLCKPKTLALYNIK